MWGVGEQIKEGKRVRTAEQQLQKQQQPLACGEQTVDAAVAR
jgi:hypothetical protein